MRESYYYHMFANGGDARNFILSQDDYYAAFNRVGVCAANTSVKVLAFSIEDTHPHLLIYGPFSDCIRFKELFENMTLNYVGNNRRSRDGVAFRCSLYKIDSEEYLRNVAIYVIVQPTKDGKGIMPYDYLWGTGSMYFRPARHIPIWHISEEGENAACQLFGELQYSQKRKITRSAKYSIPDNWKICNSFILPSNYVAVEQFENIFKTHNRFRAFMAQGKTAEAVIITKMADVIGLSVADSEARNIARQVCSSLYSENDISRLPVDQRLIVAMTLRNRYRFSFRQLSTISNVPEEELRRYF